MLCDSNGYTVDFNIYTGKSSVVSGKGLSFDAVMSLVRKEFLGSGYHMYVIIFIPVQYFSSTFITWSLWNHQGHKNWCPKNQSECADKEISTGFNNVDQTGITPFHKMDGHTRGECVHYSTHCILGGHCEKSVQIQQWVQERGCSSSYGCQRLQSLHGGSWPFRPVDWLLFLMEKKQEVVHDCASPFH